MAVLGGHRFSYGKRAAVSIRSVGYSDKDDASPCGARLRGGGDFAADDYCTAFGAGGFGYGAGAPGGAVDVEVLGRPG